MHGALGALFGELEQVEVEKRGAAEDEMIKARSEAEEVEMEISVFLVDT